MPTPNYLKAPSNTNEGVTKITGGGAAAERYEARDSISTMSFVED